MRAFERFGGVPARISYQNLATAVKLALDTGPTGHGHRGYMGDQRYLRGRLREPHRSFVALRSQYLFASHLCTPWEAHEKDGVEHGVGYVRRTFLVHLPDVASL